MLVDSHCHLDFPDFADDLENIVARAAAAVCAVNSPAAMRRFFAARISPRTDSPIPSYPF